MVAKALVICAVALLLAGCSSFRTGSLCTAGPFIPDEGAAQRWTKSELIVLNEAGEEICGWRPVSR